MCQKLGLLFVHDKLALPRRQEAATYIEIHTHIATFWTAALKVRVRQLEIMTEGESNQGSLSKVSLDPGSIRQEV